MGTDITDKNLNSDELILESIRNALRAMYHLQAIDNYSNCQNNSLHNAAKAAFSIYCQGRNYMIIHLEKTTKKRDCAQRLC